MIYYVIELQSGTVGSSDVIAYSPADYADPWAEALAKYHTVLAVAAKSAVPIHGCLIVNSDGDVEKREFIHHKGGNA